MNNFEYTNLEEGSARLKGIGQNANWGDEIEHVWTKTEFICMLMSDFYIYDWRNYVKMRWNDCMFIIVMLLSP
jgi:hypothetical protein